VRLTHIVRLLTFLVTTVIVCAWSRLTTMQYTLNIKLNFVIYYKGEKNTDLCNNYKNHLCWIFSLWIPGIDAINQS